MAKTDCEVVTYTAIFGSTAIQEEQPSESPAPEAPASLDMGTDYLPVLGAVGGVIALMVAACWGFQKMKERKMRT